MTVDCVSESVYTVITVGIGSRVLASEKPAILHGWHQCFDFVSVASGVTVWLSSLNLNLDCEYWKSRWRLDCVLLVNWWLAQQLLKMDLKYHDEQHLKWKCLGNTHTQPFNGLWSGTTQVGQYQKKHSPTPTHPDHQTSFINFLHLLWSIASSLFSLHARLSSLTTFLQVLFGLPLGLGPTGFQYPLWLVSFLLPAPTILGLIPFHLL